MYGIFTDIWLIFMVNVGKYTIHGWYGYVCLKETKSTISSVPTTEQYSRLFGWQDLMGRLSPENKFQVLKIATLEILTDP